MSEKRWTSGKKENPHIPKGKPMTDKKPCPVCGKNARQYADGTWEQHKLYDSKRKTVFSTCNGRPPILKKEK